jgi:tRNA (guanine37-N1)-methyltransferase
MNFHIITLFPESFDSYINSSIIGRAIHNKKIKVKFYDPRNFVKPTKIQKKNRKPYLRVDDKPYAGGPGMVMQAFPVIKAIEKALGQARGKQKSTKVKIIWLSPGAKQFTNETAEIMSKKYKGIVIICGRYEGIDSRVKKIFKVEEISVGPYVLTGGELPAMVILDTIARRIPGVLGKIESVEENRVSSSEVYTRPEVLEYKGKKYRVPKILVSGDHKKIEEWKNKHK